MIKKKFPLLSFESSSLDSRKGKMHFVNINVIFISLSKTFFQKFVFSSKDSYNASFIVPLFLHCSHMTHASARCAELLWLRIGYVKCLQSFKTFVPKGLEMRKKSLERHFYAKITSRAGSEHGPCLMNNTTNIFVVLDLIVLHNGDNLLKMNDRFEADH